MLIGRNLFFFVCFSPFFFCVISLDGSDGCGHTVLTECVLQVLEKEVEEEDGFQIGRDKLMACILNVSRKHKRSAAQLDHGAQRGAAGPCRATQ